MSDEFSDLEQKRIDTLIGRFALLEAKTSSAHQRMDKLDIAVREDLKELKISLKEMSQELKDVVAWMNRGKGWAAAILLLAGLVGGLVSKML